MGDLYIYFTYILILFTHLRLGLSSYLNYASTPPTSFNGLHNDNFTFFYIIIIKPMTWTQKCVVRIFQSKFIYVYVFCGGGGVTMYLSAQRNVSQDVNIQQTTEEVSNLAQFVSSFYVNRVSHILHSTSFSKDQRSRSLSNYTGFSTHFLQSLSRVYRPILLFPYPIVIILNRCGAFDLSVQFI